MTPVMIYGTETRPVRKAQEKRLDVAEIKILRWLCGVDQNE